MGLQFSPVQFHARVVVYSGDFEKHPFTAAISRNTRFPAGAAEAVNCLRYVTGPANDCVPRSSHYFSEVMICLPLRSNVQSPPNSASIVPAAKDGSDAPTPVGSGPITTTLAS